jgi:hypothetical protein
MSEYFEGLLFYFFLFLLDTLFLDIFQSIACALTELGDFPFQLNPFLAF